MFGAQVIWNAIPFGCIRAANSFLPVEEFEISAGVKLEQDEETGLTKVTGRTPQTCRFSVRAHTLAGTDPRTVFEILSALRGKTAGVYIANGAAPTLAANLLATIQTSDWRKLFSGGGAVSLAKQLIAGTAAGVQFMLTDVTQDAVADAHGNIYESKITLNLTENAPESQTGGLRIEINGEDVTESIALTAGTYEMHADGAADALDLLFADTADRWNNWNPGETGDTIRLTDGAVDTGKLYLDAIKPESGKYRLLAYSTPRTMFTTKSRSFTGLSLPQLAAKIAGEHGLTLKTYSVPETAAAYNQQRNESDLAFLSREAASNSCAFLIYDGALCLYAQKELETAAPAKTLTLSASDTLTATADKHAAASRVELRNGTETGTAEDPAAPGGRTHRETVTATWETTAAANAAAAARLREINRNTHRAEIETAMQRQLAAGSVISVDTAAWNGPAFIYRLRHDFSAKKSKIFIRRPLEY